MTKNSTRSTPKNTPRSSTPARKQKAQTPRTPEVAAKIDQVIDSYRPLTNPHAYPHIGGFVRELARAAEPTTFHNTRRALSMINGLVSWRWLRTGCNLTPETILTDAVIRLYVNTVLADHAHAYRFDTTRLLGALATKLTGQPTHRLPQPNILRLAPYTSAEMAQLHSWAVSLPTVLSRRNAATLLALGAGAGLTPAEIIAVRKSDIRADGDQRWVTVRGTTAREVPVRTDWVRVLDRARATDEDLLFHGHQDNEYAPRPIQGFLSSHPGPVRLTPMRLRSGYIASLLTAGVPVPVIADLLGVGTLSTVTDYYVHANTGTVRDHLDTILAPAVTR